MNVINGYDVLHL